MNRTQNVGASRPETLEEEEDIENEQALYE